MAQFSVNTQRFDPYKNFKFRVKWDGRYVAGISKVGLRYPIPAYGTQMDPAMGMGHSYPDKK